MMFDGVTYVRVRMGCRKRVMLERCLARSMRCSFISSAALVVVRVVRVRPGDWVLVGDFLAVDDVDDADRSLLLLVDEDASCKSRNEML
jgi:hypothetical protein